MDVATFPGFPKPCLTFFRNLAKNNNKTWFDEHKGDYAEHVLAPARGFVLALGERLRKISPGIQADPRVNRSLFRINRDTRFSKDKTPYKTHLGLWFWDGPGKRMESSGFYFQLEPKNLMLGVGIYCFPKDLLETYRESAVDPKLGPALKRAVESLTKDGGIRVGGQHYKRVPRGYDPDHENAGLLLHNGLYAGMEMKPPDELFTDKAVAFCFERYKKMKPLHTWLMPVTDKGV